MQKTRKKLTKSIVYMKKLSIILIATFVYLVGDKADAQITTSSLLNSPGISKTEIVGVWQISSPQVTANLLENFQFFANGKFVYNYDSEDDTRTIFQLIGNYRMLKNQLFFTVVSRKERVGGGLATGAIGTDDYLFVFDNNSTRVVQYKKPKELDPVLVWDAKKTSKYFKIKINNRVYFKLSSNPKEFSGK